MQKEPPILLVEDEEDDIFFLQRSLDKSGIFSPLIVARDGKEVVEYLKQPFSELHPKPGLLLLDLNMPEMTGFEVLSWLATQPHLASIKVVVLSSSDDAKDRQTACQLGAVDYRIKPHKPENLATLVQDLRARWLCPANTPA